MDEKEKVATYGVCVVCGAPRDKRLVKTSVYTKMIMICTENPSHKQ